ncbi:MAG TPA: hypothetical protein VIW67_03785 [Terriglobales bacterium]|jgi:hypothetical protein
MEARRKTVSEMNFGAGKYLSTLARIMYAPQDEVREEVEAARERITQLGTIHCPPETDDENLVSLYDQIAASVPEN